MGLSLDELDDRAGREARGVDRIERLVRVRAKDRARAWVYP